MLIMWSTAVEHGFPAQSWLTFRQALSLGGNVSRGELGTTVVRADLFIPYDEKCAAETRAMSRTRPGPVASCVGIADATSGDIRLSDHRVNWAYLVPARSVPSAWQLPHMAILVARKVSPAAGAQ